MTDTLDDLTRVLVRSLRRLGELGDQEAACRLAAEGWSLLRRDHPRAADRLNALLHFLTRPQARRGDLPMADSEVLDVRSDPPAARHDRIFATFARLAPGTSFLLVNDHDPKPLYYQLAFEHQGEFTWEYVEQGPEVWKVRIGKAAKGD